MSDIKNKINNNRIYKSSKRFVYARAFSFMLILSFLTLAIVTNIPTYNITDGKILFAVTIFTLLTYLTFFISVFMLDAAHGGKYWYLVDKKRNKQDERELHIRSQVFEKSFYFVCLSILALLIIQLFGLFIYIAIFLEGFDNSLRSFIIEFINQFKVDYIVTALLVISFPNLIASTIKES